MLFLITIWNRWPYWFITKKILNIYGFLIHIIPLDSFKVHSVSKNFVRYFAQPLSLAKKVTLRNVSVVPIWACRLAGSKSISGNRHIGHYTRMHLFWQDLVSLANKWQSLRLRVVQHLNHKVLLPRIRDGWRVESWLDP